MLIYGPKEYLADWAGKRLGIKDWGPCSTIGVIRGFEIVAVAVYNNYIWPNIEASIVSTDRRWATPDVIRVLMRYPFVQLGVKRLTSTTAETNQPARAFLCRLGFRQEGVHPDALPDGTAISYGLLRRDAERWLAEEGDEQRRRRVSATGT